MSTLEELVIELEEEVAKNVAYNESLIQEEDPYELIVNFDDEPKREPTQVITSDEEKLKIIQADKAIEDRLEEAGYKGMEGKIEEVDQYEQVKKQFKDKDTLQTGERIENIDTSEVFKSKKAEEDARALGISVDDLINQNKDSLETRTLEAIYFDIAKNRGGLYKEKKDSQGVFGRDIVGLVSGEGTDVDEELIISGVTDTWSGVEDPNLIRIDAVNNMIDFIGSKDELESISMLNDLANKDIEYQTLLKRDFPAVYNMAMSKIGEMYYADMLTPELEAKVRNIIKVQDVTAESGLMTGIEDIPLLFLAGEAQLAGALYKTAYAISDENTSHRRFFKRGAEMADQWADTFMEHAQKGGILNDTDLNEYKLNVQDAIRKNRDVVGLFKEGLGSVIRSTPEIMASSNLVTAIPFVFAKAGEFAYEANPNATVQDVVDNLPSGAAYVGLNKVEGKLLLGAVGKAFTVNSKLVQFAGAAAATVVASAIEAPVEMLQTYIEEKSKAGQEIVFGEDGNLSPRAIRNIENGGIFGAAGVGSTNIVTGAPKLAAGTIQATKETLVGKSKEQLDREYGTHQEEVAVEPKGQKTFDFEIKPYSEEHFDSVVEQAKEAGIPTPRVNFKDMTEDAQKASIDHMQSKLDKYVELDEKAKQDRELSEVSEEIKNYTVPETEVNEAGLTKTEYNKLNRAVKKQKEGKELTFEEQTIIDTNQEYVDSNIDTIGVSNSELEFNAVNVDENQDYKLDVTKTTLNKAKAYIKSGYKNESLKPFYNEYIDAVNARNELINQISPKTSIGASEGISDNNKVLNQLVKENKDTGLINKFKRVVFKEAYDRAENERTASDIAEDPEFSEYQETLKKVASNNNATVRFTDNQIMVDENGNQAIGLYDGESNSAVVNNKDKVRNTAHELVHSVVDKAIAGNSRVRNKAKMLMAATKQAIGDKGQYGFTNENEFFAEYFGNNDFRNQVYNNKGIFNKIKNFVKDILGKGNKKLDAEINKLFDEMVKDTSENKSIDVRASKAQPTAIEKHGVLGASAIAADRMFSRKQFYRDAKSAVANSDFVKKLIFEAGKVSDNMNKVVDDLLSASNNMDKEIDKIIKQYASVLNKALTGFSENEKVELTKSIMYTELARIYTETDYGAELDGLIANNFADIQGTINSLKSEMTAEQVEAIENLAHFMVTQEGTVDTVLNPELINKRTGADIGKTKFLLTLMALSKTNNDALVKLHKNKDSFKDIIDAQHALNNNSDKLFSDKEKHRKMYGYSRDSYGNNKKEFIVVSELEKDKLLNDTKTEWKEHHKMGGGKTMLVRRDLTEEFRHGVVPIQQMAYSGELIMSNEQASALNEEQLKRMFRKDKHIVPVYNKDGRVVNFRYMMTKEDKRDILDLEENIVTVASKTAGSIVRKMASEEIQQSAFDQLVSSANDRIDLESSNSVFLTETDSIKNLADLDSSISNEYRVLSEEEIAILPKEFSAKNKKVKFIRKDASDVILGYREFFFSDRANRKARYMEKMFKGLVSEFKKNVVIKYPVVLMNNLISNESILLMHLKNPSHAGLMVRYQIEAAKNLELLKGLENRRAYYQMKVDAGDKSYQSRLNNVNKAISRNPMLEAEQQGFIQSITDEVYIEGIETDNLFSKEAKRIANEKMSPAFKKLLDRKMKNGMSFGKAIKEIYMTEDSYMFSKMAGFMQKTDYVSRWALYKYSQEHLGKTKQEARQMAIDTFIDYRKNLPKEIQILSEYGIVPFATFFLRSHIAMARIANENPAKVLLTIMLLNGFYTGEGAGVRTDSWNIFNSFLDTNAVQVPFSEQMLVPMHFDIAIDSLTDPINLTRAAGFTIQ